MKTSKTSLRVARETVRHLTSTEMGVAAGGQTIVTVTGFECLERQVITIVLGLTEADCL
ncbi:MAG TPA: hypothetical protein VG245_02820 [Candidatus Dormibacteraeota bacterium]|jgi:hypothetical protein|nr:hypothetical protein [Candidatus Dormibacteraeota bacterium]